LVFTDDELIRFLDDSGLEVEAEKILEKGVLRKRLFFKSIKK